MTTNYDNYRPRQGAAGSQQYLDAAIRTASPARLRLMLTERAVEVSGTLARLWQAGENPGPNEHSLRLLEILNELLSGVTPGKGDQENQVCRQVADLYVFLSQHLIHAEAASDARAIDDIHAVLQIEAETWRAVCAREQPAAPKVPAPAGTRGPSGLNFSV